MSDDGDFELKRLAILRVLQLRYHRWRVRRSDRRPFGTLGRGAKDNDREEPWKNEEQES